MSDNIKVAIKVRPLIKRENDEHLPIQWIVEKNAILQIDPETNKRSDAEFHFDYIFDMFQTNQDVFNSTVKPIVEAAMNGFNGTIFAYGQTGSGKTYTMMGTKEEKGVIPLTVDYIFNYIRIDSSREFLLRVSYIEIYNERINDLLDKNRTDLKVKEDYHGHVVIDCKEEVTNSPECVLHAMRKGDKNRRTGETNMNDRSSRSHTIFRITIESCSKADPDGTAKEAQLNLIDLAGSERLRQTGATGERFNEGRHINLSLSTLSLVIKQLSESQSCSKFVNFRDSKLTRILQSSLGGNAMTAIICAVTPAADDETQCTLAFAVRAKGIKNKPQVNENVSDKALLKRIRTQKAKLEAEMQDMKTELAEKDKQLLRGRIALMNMQILSSNSQNEEDFRLKARRRRTWAGSSTSGSNSSGLCFPLPTIDECEQICDDEMEKLITQQNIYEIDMHNQSFHTAFADFELQLIEDQREKNRRSDGSDYIAPTITLRPQAINEEEDAENKEICSPERTPERTHNTSTSDPSPGTPKTELRKKINRLCNEYDKLREFTTLEKQLLQSDCIDAASHVQYEKKLAYITKSLSDSEQICKDLSKKYAELQSEHTNLKEEYKKSEIKCEMLQEEVQSLSSLRHTLTMLESENNDYKLKLNMALTRQKTLEDESVSHNFQMDLIKSKYKNREKELEDSLNLAWQEFSNRDEKQKFTDIVHLQSIIAELESKIALLESQSNIQTKSESLTDNNFILKVDELENSLKQSETENLAFIGKLYQSSERIYNYDETSVSNDFKIKIEEYTKRIEELEQIISQKDIELSKNNNHELALKFSEANDKLKIYENRIDEMESSIEKLQLELCEKSNELSEIKLHLNTTLHESEKTSRETQLQLEMNKEQFEGALSEIKMKELEIMEMKEILMLNKNESQQVNGISERDTNQCVSGENKSGDSILDNTQVRNDNLMDQLEERNSEIARLKSHMEKTTAEYESTIKSHQDKINELRASNEKLRDQIATIQSDITVYDGDKTAMLTLLQEKDDELEEIPRLKNQLEFMITERTEFERIIADLRTQLNEKTLEIEGLHSYESEINNLNSYNANLQSFVKKLQDENEKVKEEFESMTNSLKILENEKKVLVDKLESMNIGPINATDITSNNVKSTLDVCQDIKSITIAESSSSIKKAKPMNVPDIISDDKESSSIFSNGSYFDNMDISVTPSDLIDSTFTQNFSVVDYTMNKTNAIESKLEDSKVLLNLTCDELENCLSEKNSEELVNIVKELFNLKITLEEENVKLATNLQSKIHETIGIQNDFCAFKLDFEKLQQTILLLTTENSDMAGKLAEEKERLNEIQINSQKYINELETKLDTLMTENHADKIKIKSLQEEIDSFKDSVPKIDDEEIKQMFDLYEKKIDALVNENVEVSKNLMDKVKELESIKNKNSQECTDSCTYREKWEHLVERITILENENIDLSNNLMTKIEEFDIISEKYEALEKIKIPKSNSHEELLEKIDFIMQLAEQLKILSEKLPDLKLMLCQCTHNNELNETRQAIKANMELLNNRLHSFQENFERVRIEAEKLTNKVNQDLNVSLNETSINSSTLENVDISFVEDKVQLLQAEYETLHDSLKKWSILNEKLSDSEKLRDNNTSILDISRQSLCESPKTSKRDAKIDRRQIELEKCKIEQQQLTKTINSFEKFQHNMTHMQHEIKKLRAAKEMYIEKINNAEKFVENAEERVRSLTEKVKVLNDQFEETREDNKKLDKIKLTLEEELQKLQREKSDKTEILNELRQSLTEAESNNQLLRYKLDELEKIFNEKSSLENKSENYQSEIVTFESKIQDLTKSSHDSEQTNDILKPELNKVKSTLSSEREKVMNSELHLEQCKKNIELLETTVKELREKLSCYEKENAHLSDQITRLQVLENKSNLNVSDNHMEICDESFSHYSSQDKSSIEELADARARITKEIATLQNIEVNKLNEKSVSDLFNVFILALMSKEKELIKTIHRRHEREKEELIEKNKQSIDEQKRSTSWAKELELENERLQNDLTMEESKIKTLKAQIFELENTLKDSEHEKQLLNEKMTVMEADFNALQADYDKYSKPNLQSGDVTNVLNEREKYLQETMEKRENEYKIKIAKVESEYKKKIEELYNAMELNKTKNMDLKKELEALEANERQLKSIIDLKTNELNKANSTIQCLQGELKNLTDVCNQANDDNQMKNQKIEEITAILKIKCDKMSEYKTNLETIKPEYEILKTQATERQLRLEVFKNEVEKLREESTRQISLMKDQLDSQEIKSAGLTKQLADVTNRNTIIQSELEQLKEKCQELERENERLVKKMRNSKSKLTAEREMEDLRDENRMHLRNLEGATNRIVDLQKHKSQLMKEQVELQGRYELLCQENNELKNILKRSKMSGNEAFELRDKYDLMVQEKNQIALELAEKRTLIGQLETKLDRMTNDNEKLKQKNIELDTEMDDIVKKIHEMDEENTELQRKIYDMTNDNKHGNRSGISSMANTWDLDNLKSCYDNVKKELEVVTMSNELLKKDNAELRCKIGYKDKHGNDGKSCASSRSVSPIPINRSRQRRSDLFNQNRSLGCAENAVEVVSTDCQIEQLKKQIIQLEQDAVSKKARIVTLELQIESQMFPYETKCSQLEEAMLKYKQRNMELLTENNELRTKKMDCMKCMNWNIIRRDQGTQISPKKPKIYLSGSSKSGIVEEHALEQTKIKKLENDKHTLKIQLKRRFDEILELKEKLKELQNQSESLRSTSNNLDKNFKHVMKENVPANVTGQLKLIASQRNWFN